MVRCAGRSRRLLGTAALALSLALAGCGATDWFGSDEERLEGERIDVLGPERRLEATSELEDRKIRLPRPTSNGAWAQPGGTADHAPGHLALADAPREAWRADIGTASDDRGQIISQPVVAQGRVYTLDADTTVTAFDAGNGERVWQRDLGEDEDGAFGGGLAVQDDRLFVTTGLGTLFALEAGSGETLWTYQAGAPMRAGPSVRDGRVYAITLVNETIALSVEDGSEVWSHQGIEEQAGLLGSASPAASGSAVTVAYSSGELFALLPENGRAIWSDSLAGLARTESIAELADVRAMPVIDNNRVFAVSNANRMTAIDMRRGARVWEKPLSGIEMPWIAGDWLFLVTSRAELLALERESGGIRWVTQLDRWEDPEDKDGTIVWQGPVLAGDRLILAGSHGRAVSISPYTGEMTGAIELPGRPAAPPVVAGETLYILTDGATLTAYR